MKHKKHWYKTTFHICPACGRQSLYKERVYGRKPKTSAKIFITTEIYDFCIERGRL